MGAKAERVNTDNSGFPIVYQTIDEDDSVLLGMVVGRLLGAWLTQGLTRLPKVPDEF